MLTVFSPVMCIHVGMTQVSVDIECGRFHPVGQVIGDYSSQARHVG